MPHVYEQITGNMFDEGRDLIGKGYSGAGIFKNDPTAQNIPDHGPIPVGRYTIGQPHDSPTHGPYSLPLTPDPTNEMFGRSAFLIHGDSVHAPGTASEGCIIMARGVREQIGAGLATDDLLIVVSGLLG